MHYKRRIIITLLIVSLSLLLMDKGGLLFWPGTMLLILSLLRGRSITRDFLRQDESQTKKGGVNDIE